MKRLSDILYELMPKRLDWYIIKKFILSFFLSILLIIIIVIIFDISEKVDDFISHNVPLEKIVWDYYLNFIPYFINMFSPLFVFLTVILFSSRLAANSEIVAVLSCGISFNRLLRPYMLSAAFIALFSLSLNLWIIPKANKTRTEFETAYVTDYSGANNPKYNMHYQLAPGTFVYVESFSPWNNTAYKFTLETIEDNEITTKLSAEQAVWDSTKCCWTLKRYFLRQIDADLGDRVKNGDKLDTTLALTLKDFKKSRDFESQLTRKELNEYINTKKMRGDADIKAAEIEKHIRWAMPFSAFILTIMGVALSSRRKRGGIGWNLALGIALSFSYILFQKFSEMFVFTDTMPASVALWLPNIVFAVIAYVLYRRAPK